MFTFPGDYVSGPIIHQQIQNIPLLLIISVVRKIDHIWNKFLFERCNSLVEANIFYRFWNDGDVAIYYKTCKK